jgi:autotransporter-associated beta strand protein
VNFRANGALTMTGAVDANTLTLNSPSTTSLTTRQIKNLTFGMKLNGILSAGAWTSPAGAPTAISALFQIGETSAATALTAAPLTIGDNKVLHISGNGATQRLSATLAQSNLVINIPIIDNPGGSSSLVFSGLNAIPNNTTSLADSVILGSTGNTSLVGPYNTFTGGIVVASGILRAGAFANLCLGGGSTTLPGIQALPVNVTVEKGAILRPDRNVFKGNLTLNGGAIWPSNGFGDRWEKFSGTGSITLGADSVFYTSSTGKFTVLVPVQGPGGVTKTGSSTGQVVFRDTNTYTGPTKIWGGVLQFISPASLYNSDATKWTASNITVTPIGYSPAGTAPSTLINPTLRLSVGGTHGFSPAQISSLVSNLTSAVNNNGLMAGSTLSFDATDLSTNTPVTVAIDAVIKDSVGTGGGAVNVSTINYGTVELTGANTFTGKTTIEGFASGGQGTAFSGAYTFENGSLSVSSLNSVVGGTASSSLGAPTTVANGTIDFGNAANNNRGKLVYTGITNETTDRVLAFLGNVALAHTIDQSGTAALKFTSPFSFPTSGSNKDVVLQGSTSGTGEVAAAIVNPTSGVTGIGKKGTGTWILSGTNTYTGGTSIEQGVLAIGGAGTLGAGTYVNGMNISGELFYNSSANQTLSGFLFDQNGDGVIRKGGSGTLTISGIPSVNAAATTTLTGDAVTGITMTSGTGKGYPKYVQDYSGIEIPYTVTISGGGGSGATATALVDYFSGNMSLTLNTTGSGYTSAPDVTITPAPSASLGKNNLRGVPLSAAVSIAWESPGRADGKVPLCRLGDGPRDA